MSAQLRGWLTLAEVQIDKAHSSWFLRAARNYSGRSGLRAAAAMGGRTGAVMCFRFPSLGARGMHVRPEWVGALVEFAGVVQRNLTPGATEPWAVELAPGSYGVEIFSRDGRSLVGSRFVVAEGRVTVIDVFPAIWSLSKSKYVRPGGGIEWGLYDKAARKVVPPT